MTGAELVCVSAFCLSLLSSAEARAAGFAVTLEYAAASGCPGAADLEAVVVARLGYDPFANDGQYHVALRITPRGGSLDGRIEWRDSAGKWAGDQAFRTVDSDCLYLTRTMGLALAVQIQLLADMGAAPHVDLGAASETQPPPAAAARPTAKSPDAAVPSSEPLAVSTVSKASPLPSGGPRPVFALGTGPSVGFGMSSTPVLLGRVFGSLAWRYVSVELAGEASLPAITRRADGAGVSQQLLLVSAAGCASLKRWNACLLVNAGEVRMVGEDVDRPTSARVPVVEVGARVGFIQRLGDRGFLRAHVDGLIILTRWVASLDDVPVWTTPRFAAAIGLDAGVRFP